VLLAHSVFLIKPKKPRGTDAASESAALHKP
jgi:hypothetical protein